MNQDQQTQEKPAQEKPAAGLLAIGSRVTHFDGSPSTWGKGTIIAYNGRKPMAYLKTNFKDAVEMAGGAGLLDGLINSMYDGQRCPYVVRWDVRVGNSDHDNEMRIKYPRGYVDVYGDECRPINNGQNVFPNDWIRIMGRVWNRAISSWSEWIFMPVETYERNQSDPEWARSIAEDWEFIVRPYPTPRPRNSPADDSFYPLAKWEEGFEGRCLQGGKNWAHPNGYQPPYGLFVEFEVLYELHGPVLVKGQTATLTNMGPANKTEVVFVTGPPGKTKTYPMCDVIRWRELANWEDFTEDMMEYISKELRPT